MAFAVGIDLGTTNTAIAVVQDGVAATLHGSEEGRLLPSVVSFHPSGSVLVGRRAVERRLIDPSNTIYSIKRLIGRPWDSAEVREARDKLPFDLREGLKGATLVVARGDTFSLPEISAFVLRKAKAIAEAALGEPVERAVITVPANFNDLQRAATKMAGRLSGFDVIRILNEPTAAALAYGPAGKSHERVAVYDFGGGTFDVTLLDVAPSVFEVLATAGDSTLGGDDIDVVVAERMADDLLKKHRFDARGNRMVFGRLRILGEQMKRELSVRDEFEIAVDDIVTGDRGATVTWRFRMTRPELEWASLAIVERTFKVCQLALQSAAITAGDLDRIILVGGVTRMPMVARKVEQFFGRPPIVRINPAEVVALGAAIQAAALDPTRPRGTQPSLPPSIDASSLVELVTTETADQATLPDLPLIQASAPKSDGAQTPIVSSTGPNVPPPPRDPRGALPTVARPGGATRPPATTPSSSPADEVLADPDLAGTSRAARPVASSATFAEFLPRVRSKPLVFDVLEAQPQAVPAAPAQPGQTKSFVQPALSPITAKATTLLPVDAPATTAVAAPRPRQRGPLLIDVTPLTLNVETVGGFCDMLIDANTPVPCDRTRTFATASDGQTTVRVRVAQGESKRFSDNAFLGELELTGIAAETRGKAQIAVTFEIDVDGILNVRARDVKTGSETGARIQLAGAQTDPAEIQAMRSRQVAHARRGPTWRRNQRSTRVIVDADEGRSGRVLRVTRRQELLRDLAGAARRSTACDQERVSRVLAPLSSGWVRHFVARRDGHRPGHLQTGRRSVPLPVASADARALRPSARAGAHPDRRQPPVEQAASSGRSYARDDRPDRAGQAVRS
jgi:molecular chaperone DnaK